MKSTECQIINLQQKELYDENQNKKLEKITLINIFSFDLWKGKIVIYVISEQNIDVLKYWGIAIRTTHVTVTEI